MDSNNKELGRERDKKKMPLQYTPIVLGTALIIGIGFFIYNTLVNNAPQAQTYGSSSRQQDDDYNSGSWDAFSDASSVYGEDQDDAGSTTSRRRTGKKQDRCSICLGTLIKNKTLKTLRCTHTYHHNCITQWLHSEKSCPLCRAPVRL